MRELEITASAIANNRDHISNRDLFNAQMYPASVSYNNYSSRSFSQPHTPYNNQIPTTVDMNNQLFHYQQFIQEFHQNQMSHFGYAYTDGQHYPPYENMAYYQNSYINPAYFPNRYPYF